MRASRVGWAVSLDPRWRDGGCGSDILANVLLRTGEDTRTAVHEPPCTNARRRPGDQPRSGGRQRGAIASMTASVIALMPVSIDGSGTGAKNGE